MSVLNSAWNCLCMAWSRCSTITCSALTSVPSVVVPSSSTSSGGSKGAMLTAQAVPSARSVLHALFAGTVLAARTQIELQAVAARAQVQRDGAVPAQVQDTPSLAMSLWSMTKVSTVLWPVASGRSAEVDGRAVDVWAKRVREARDTRSWPSRRCWRRSRSRTAP